MIIDTHAHVVDVRFDSDREVVIRNAFSSGVKAIFEIACEVNYWDKALELSKRDDIFASFGIHPNNVSRVIHGDFDRLETLVKNEKCIAIGEIGLDYHYSSSMENANFQRELFIKQVDIANKYNKPVIIHCRDAYEDMIDILEKYKTVSRGVVHCFSGNLKQAKIFVKAGFLLGIGGILTYNKSDSLKQVVFETDISNLLCETDCPYLAPQKYRGQRNEPSYIVETLKEIAKIKEMPFNETAQMTTQNALKLFDVC
ncbi:MAG: TatD family hydrolase [Endomicrobium sp.]|jgi:TatD DNase family protein|nr:TatD family hydrolase [Endomicrobium sp.]